MSKTRGDTKFRQRGKGFLLTQMPQRNRRVKKAKLGTLRVPGGHPACNCKLLKRVVGEEKQKKKYFLYSAQNGLVPLCPRKSLINCLRKGVLSSAE